MSSDVRVLLVESSQWARKSLELGFATPGSGTQHAASAATGGEALAIVAGDVAFEVALVALELPDVPGAKVIQAICSARSHVVCVAFTTFDDRSHVLGAIRAGANGYLLKSEPVEVILQGVRDAALGGAPMTPAIAKLVLCALRDHERQTPTATDRRLEVLTKREREVLAILARGTTYRDTSVQLGVSLGAVQGHVKRIYVKLRVDSKAEAAAIAQRAGLI